MPPVDPIGPDPDHDLRETMLNIQRRYMAAVQSLPLVGQYLDRLIKSGQVSFNPETRQIGVRGLRNEPWEGSEMQADYQIDENRGENRPGTHDYFRYRFPGVGAFGDTDILSDALARNVYGDEPTGQGPSGRVNPWEYENWQPLQGGEYAPWEGEPYGRESLNSTAFDPTLAQPQEGGLEWLLKQITADAGFGQALPLGGIGEFQPAPPMLGPGGFAPAPQLGQIGGFTPAPGLAGILASGSQGRGFGTRSGGNPYQKKPEIGELGPAAEGAPLWPWQEGSGYAPPVKGRAATGGMVRDEEGDLPRLGKVPVEQVQPKVLELISIYGNKQNAAIALADRHGGKPGSWAMTLNRILGGSVPDVYFDIFDKLDVMI